MSVILYEKKNGIGIITLNRPEKRNALNSAMINGLGQYLHEAGRRFRCQGDRDPRRGRESIYCRI